jgi:hypothetical protein
VVELRAGIRPGVVDLAHPRGADDPQRVEPAVGEHPPDGFGSGTNGVFDSDHV